MTHQHQSADEIARGIQIHLRTVAEAYQPDRAGDWPGVRSNLEYARLAAVVGTALLSDALNSESQKLLDAILAATKAETTSLHTDADADEIADAILHAADAFADYSREVIASHNRARDTQEADHE